MNECQSPFQDFKSCLCLLVLWVLGTEFGIVTLLYVLDIDQAYYITSHSSQCFRLFCSKARHESAKTESVAEIVALSVAIFDMVHWVRSISLHGLGKSSCVPQLPAVFIPAGKLHWGKPSHRALSYIYASWHHAVLHLLPSNVIPNRPWQWEKITWAYYEYKCVKYI